MTLFITLLERNLDGLDWEGLGDEKQVCTSSKIIIGTFKALKNYLSEQQSWEPQTDSYQPVLHKSCTGLKAPANHEVVAENLQCFMWLRWHHGDRCWGAVDLGSCLLSGWCFFLFILPLFYFFFSCDEWESKYHFKEQGSSTLSCGREGQGAPAERYKKFLSLVGKVHHRLTALRAMWAFIHHQKSGTPWCDNLDKFRDMYWSILKSQSDLRGL